MVRQRIVVAGMILAVSLLGCQAREKGRETSSRPTSGLDEAAATVPTELIERLSASDEELGTVNYLILLTVPYRA